MLGCGPGLGARGISAIKQLLRHGGVGGHEVWCIDADRTSMDMPTANIHILETDGVGPCQLLSCMSQQVFCVVPACCFRGLTSRIPAATLCILCNEKWCGCLWIPGSATMSCVCARALQSGKPKAVLSNDVLRRIVGEGARDRGGKGNANVGDGGVAFVLTSASAVPGSTDLVRTGHMLLSPSPLRSGTLWKILEE